jgi:hypothetical protein
MRRFFPNRSYRGVYVNPPLWRGPACVLSDRIRKDGVDIRTLGITKWDSCLKSKEIIVIVVRSQTND